jgi:preprotein translocase subunit YajC
MNFTTILAQAAPDAGGGMTSTFIMFGAIILIFYFMIIRPQQKRIKDQQALIGGVKRGDRVVLSNGMHGAVHEVEEKTVLVEIAKNTVVRFEKGSIQSIQAQTPATTP